MMRNFLFGFLVGAPLMMAQVIPTFSGTFATSGQTYTYTMVGRKPETGGTTGIPTVVVPVSLSFAHGRLPRVRSAVAKLIASPVFGDKQYGDGLQRAQFDQPETSDWHTLLTKPMRENEIRISVPLANGYVLHSRRSHRSLGVVDVDFVEKQLSERLPPSVTADKLVIFVLRDAAFYSLSDATVCCSVGTHGALGPAKQPFVMASYFDAGAMARYSDIQGITQQLGEWLSDPWRTNKFPRWLKPAANLSCGGGGEASAYLLEQPTDSVAGGNATEVRVRGREYHLENMALLAWFAGAPGGAYSYPDRKALPSAAQPCGNRRAVHVPPTASPVATGSTTVNHKLIGYWEGYSSVRSPVPLRDVSPQWDIIIATFATPVKGSTSLLHFEPPAALGKVKFKADVAYLQSLGKKVLISLGGGGQVVTLQTPEDLRDFVMSVSAIVEKYGFDGVDLDIETPSLLIDAGDTDFRHPTTASIVNLIAAMRQMHEHFGAKFMIGEVPEAAQAQSGMRVYGGQFGSFLPVIYGTRDILSFVDAQDYNTPPLEGLDGNYYFPGNADYHVALTEMLVHGFPVAGAKKILFPALPAEQVAIGLPATPSSARNYTEIAAIKDALGYLIEGKRYAGAAYKLRRAGGYPRFLGAMFWAINEDRRNDYEMSNAIGTFVHELR